MVDLTYRLEGGESDDNKIEILLEVVIRAINGSGNGDASLSSLAILTGSGIEIETTPGSDYDDVDVDVDGMNQIETQ